MFALSDMRHIECLPRRMMRDIECLPCRASDTLRVLPVLAEMWQLWFTCFAFKAEVPPWRPLIGYKAVADLFDGQAAICCPMTDFLFGHIGEPEMDQIFCYGLGTIENLSRMNSVIRSSSDFIVHMKNSQIISGVFSRSRAAPP